MVNKNVQNPKSVTSPKTSTTKTFHKTAPTKTARKAKSRQKIIIRASIIGVLTNLTLVIFKMIIGLLAASNAIVVDAINNLTDVLSSVVTIIGTKLAARRPDREHPYGHGRYEYLTALVVGVIVLSVGVFALAESVPKIFHPELADYSLASIIVVASATVVKIVLSRYIKKVGREQNSSSLVASGIDAMFDAALSFSTLIGIFSTMLFHFSLDGILGVVIALFIIKSSLGILGDSVIDIMGGRTNHELSRKLHNFVCSFPEVSGAYDLILHDYGPSSYIGSIHIQVPDHLTAKEIHRLTSEIAQRALAKYNVTLTVGIYAENSQTKTHQAMRRQLEEIVQANPDIHQTHGFYVDDQQKLVTFDLVIDYFYRDKLKLKNRIIREFRRTYPEYRCRVTLDMDTGLDLQEN